MEGGITNRVASSLKGHEQYSEVEPTFKVEPVEAVEKHQVEHSTENPNETPKNFNPYPEKDKTICPAEKENLKDKPKNLDPIRGHNIDIRV